MNKIRGEWSSRRVWLDGRELNPAEGQKLRNHSPDGFNWGYGGSGPAQLAVTLCLEAGKLLQARPLSEVRIVGGVPGARALPFYQHLKWEFVAVLPQSDFEVEFDLEGWLSNKLQHDRTEVAS
jgi:hypothetical protein